MDKIEIITASHYLGAHSEVFIYNQITNLSHYHANHLCYEKLNATDYSYPETRVLAKPSFKDKLLSRLNRNFSISKYSSPWSKSFFSTIKKMPSARFVHFQQLFLPIRFSQDIAHLKKPIIVTGHGTDVVSPIYHETIRKSEPFIQKFIAISNFIADQFRVIGIPNEKIITNYIGVKVPENLLEPISTNIFNILCIGRLSEVKDHLTLLKAFKLALERNADLQLNLVGSGPLKNQLEKYCESNKISSKVLFHGEIPNMQIRTLLQQANAVVLTSKRIQLAVSSNTYHCEEEGFGLALAEGASYGKPLLGTKSGGIREIVIDGESGFLVDEMDSVSLSERILELASNPKLARRLGENAYTLVKSKFNFNTQIKSLESIYDTVQ